MKPKKDMGVVGVVAVLAALFLLIGIKLISNEPQDEPLWEAEAVAFDEEVIDAPISADSPRLVVRGIETQHTEIVVDGETFFSDRLAGGEILEPPAGRVVSVQIPDLTRARVVYDGSLVQPLGKMTMGRKLVFVNDSL